MILTDNFNSLIQFYDACAKSGTVRVVRNQDIITIYSPTIDSNPKIRHAIGVLPINIKKVCYITPRRSVRIAKKLLEIRDKWVDKSFIIAIPTFKGNRYKILCLDNDGKVLYKWSFGCFTLNY